MATSSLYPPNSHSLSDGVIRKVVQRTGSAHVRVDNDTESRLNLNHLIRSEPDGAVPIGEASTMIYNVPSYSSLMTKERTQQPNKLLGRKRPHPSPTVAATAAAEVTPKKSAPRRLIRFTRNTARYRKKQQKHLTDLDVDIDRLRDEIQKLEKDRQVISFGIPTKETVWNIAAEYFRLFRHGYIAPVTFAESQADAIPRQSHIQLEFLQATMSIDVTDGTMRGVDALLENWRLFSLYHADVQLQLERLETGPRDSVVATVKTAITITENTLRNLYPHLLVNEFGNHKWSPLAHRLLNQHIEMEGTICFGWDRSSGRVVCVETKRDILTPMLRLLGSLENVAYVFGGARITLEGMRIQEPSS